MVHMDLVEILMDKMVIMMSDLTFRMYLYNASTQVKMERMDMMAKMEPTVVMEQMQRISKFSSSMSQKTLKREQEDTKSSTPE